MRAITQREQKVIDLIRGYERAIENRRNTFTVNLGQAAIPVMQKGIEAGAFMFKKVDHTKDGKTIDVTFELGEFERYLHWMLIQANMALMPDYRLIFPDGFSIPLTW